MKTLRLFLTAVAACKQHLARHGQRCISCSIISTVLRVRFMLFSSKLLSAALPIVDIMRSGVAVRRVPYLPAGPFCSPVA